MSGFDLLNVRKGVFGAAVAAAAILFAPQVMAQGQWAWDGVSKKETDDIVTLRTPKEPQEILLNGETAKIFKDAPSGTVKVLIPSDDTGISCENIFTVKFPGDKAGQLLANHCHGDTIFDVRPGEIIDRRVTKEDIDSPEDDDAAGNSIAFEWSANGFIEIDRELVWSGRGGRNAGMSFAIPETDAFFWITECKKGEAWNYIQMARLEDKIGEQDFLQFETDNSPLSGYYADVAALPFGDGGPNSPTILLKLKPQNQLFAEMAKGNWLYIQRGRGDDAIKRRLSLKGSAAAIRAFQSGCAASAPKPVGTSAPSLSSYIGKYPYEEVRGLSIWQHPLYRRGVTDSVSNLDDRKWLLNTGVVSGPIEFKDGQAVIWACEKHNCGNRNWSVVIDAKSGETEVCFHETKGIIDRHIRYSKWGRSQMRADESCAK